MPVSRPTFFWEADVELEVKNIAFSIEAHDIGRGATKIRQLSARWLTDGKVLWNPSQRLKGWLNTQLPLARSSYRDQVQAIKVFPADGEDTWISIADVSELQGSNIALSESHEIPKELAMPFKQFMTVSDKGSKRSITTYWVVLPKAVTVKIRIFSFARGITPAIVKEALTKLGKAVGLGDKYNYGFGRFGVKSFEAREEKLNL